MNDTINMSELIEYFKDKLYQIEHDGIKQNIGEVPKFPMLIVFLGNSAMNGFSLIASEMFKLWTPFKDELCFLGVEENNNNVKCYELSMLDNRMNQEELPLEQIGDRVTNLFGLEKHFKDRSKLLVYYVLDTTSFDKKDEVEKWMKILLKIKSSLNMDNYQMMDLLFLLLNENFGKHQKVAAGIRNTLMEYIESYIESIVLLSNRRGDHVVLEDWNLCYRIIKNIIALTNSDETYITNAVFKQGIRIIGYAHEEKPSLEIGQIVVEKMIDKLSFDDNIDIFKDKELSSKLGMSEENTLSIIDTYAEQELYQLLPNAQELMLFPRRDHSNYGDFTILSERQFNEITMNAWEVYLNQIAVEVQEQMQTDASIKKHWRLSYKKLLSDNFSVGELLQLKTYLETIKKILSSAKAPSSEESVLSVAMKRLRYMLSTNKMIIDNFIEAIEELGQDAQEFLVSWKQFLASHSNIHTVSDESILEFYSQIVKGFFEHNKSEIDRKFKRVSNMKDLKNVLLEFINKIIEENPIFNEPFENELEKRLQLKKLASPITAEQYIRQNLTGSDVPVYFQTPFAYGDAVVSAILLNVGTSLHESFQDALPSNTYYYNTGKSDAAESISIYEIGEGHLITGKEENS